MQINGKLRARISVNKDATEQEALDNVKNNTKVLDGKQIIKVIYVPGRIINIIVK